MTADPDTELTACCQARATYDGDGVLYCKGCFQTIEWSHDPGTTMGVDTHGTAYRLDNP